MKMSSLVLAFWLAVGITVIAEEQEEAVKLTTFIEWDRMTTKQQTQLVEVRAKLIYYKLEKDDPVKAECMIDRFVGEVDETPDGYVGFLRKVKGVPQDKRDDNYVEYLMAGYIVNELCGDVTSKTNIKDHTAQK